VRWRFTDKILFFSPWEAILTLKAGSLEEYSLLERWGEPGRAPATLLLEACVQSARWLVEASSEFTRSCDPVEITHWQTPPGLRPGERFCALLRVEAREAEHIRFRVGQKILAPGESPPPIEAIRAAVDGVSASLLCALTPLDDRHLPADRACLWREISA
jgi:hypothetical protein